MSLSPHFQADPKFPPSALPTPPSSQLSSYFPSQLYSFKVEITTKMILKQVALIDTVQNHIETYWTFWQENFSTTTPQETLQRFQTKLANGEFEKPLLEVLNCMGKDFLTEFAQQFLQLNREQASQWADNILGNDEVKEEGCSRILVPFKNRSHEVFQLWHKHPLLTSQSLPPQFYRILIAPRTLIPDSCWIGLIVSEIQDSTVLELVKSLFAIESVPTLSTVHEIYIDEMEVAYHPLGGLDWEMVLEWRTLGPERMQDAADIYPFFFAPSSFQDDNQEVARFQRLVKVLTSPQTSTPDDVWKTQLETALVDRSDLLHLLEKIAEYELNWEKAWTGLQHPVSPSRRRSQPIVVLDSATQRHLVHTFADVMFLRQIRDNLKPDDFPKVVRQTVEEMIANKTDLDSECVRKILKKISKSES